MMMSVCVLEVEGKYCRVGILLFDTKQYTRLTERIFHLLCTLWMSVCGWFLESTKSSGLWFKGNLEQTCPWPGFICGYKTPIWQRSPCMRSVNDSTTADGTIECGNVFHASGDVGENSYWHWGKKWEKKAAIRGKHLAIFLSIFQIGCYHYCAKTC